MINTTIPLIQSVALVIDSLDQVHAIPVPHPAYKTCAGGVSVSKDYLSISLVT